jgi:ABC-type lipoprotein release transport system permease subunit
MKDDAESCSRVAVSVVLTLVALAASCIPALRAMRLDPITMLHTE